MPEVRKINLRLPDDVMMMAADQAHRMGVSTNTYILMAIRNFIPFQEKQLMQLSSVYDSMATQGGSDPDPAVVPPQGRNEMCFCGSGAKRKFCHGA